MEWNLWVHFFWWSFYGQFDYMDYTIRHYLWIDKSRIPPSELLIAWGNDYIVCHRSLGLVTGIIWDFVLYTVFCKSKTTTRSEVLDEPV